MMKVFCTKWVLTRGIEELEAEECEEHAGMVEFHRPGSSYIQYLHGEGKDWHRTEQDAIAKALVMADKKVKSLKNAIHKVEMNTARWRNRSETLRNQA